MSAVRALVPSRARLLPFAVLALTVVAAWLAVYFRPATHAYPLGDGAFIELYTHHAMRGSWTLGAYSQFGWHHPGPLYFYLLAPLYRLSDARTIALAAGVGTINLACGAGILWLLRRWALPVVAGTIGLALGVFLWRASGLTTSTWNPHAIVLPAGLFVVACAGLASGHVQTLPVVALVGSFLVQTHLSTAPFVSLLGGTALAAAVARMRRIRATMGAEAAGSLMPSLGVAAVMLGIVWALPLGEQVTGQPGNMSKIAAFFLSPSPGQPWSTAVRAWADSVLLVASPAMTLPAGWPLEPRAGVGGIALAVGQLVGLVAAARWATERGARFDAALCVMGVLASLAALWSITQIRTAIGDYMIFWLSIIGAFNWATLVGLCLVPIASTRLAPLRARALAGAVLVAVLLMSTAQVVSAIKRGRDRALDPPVGDSRHVQVLTEGLRLDLQRYGKRRPLVVISSPVWGEAAGIVLQLYKQGIPVAVGGGLGALYGAALMPTGQEDCTFYVADAAASHVLAARPHDRVVIERGRVIVHADH